MMAADYIKYLGQDRVYLRAFCEKYNVRVIDVVPNTEDFPPRGLLYIFDNQLGGFTIEGIKNSLEEKVSESVSKQR